MKNGLFRLGIHLPQIRAEGQYNLQGKVLILPLLGNGPAKINLSEYSGQSSGSGTFIKQQQNTLVGQLYICLYHTFCYMLQLILSHHHEDYKFPLNLQTRCKMTGVYSHVTN